METNEIRFTVRTQLKEYQPGSAQTGWYEPMSYPVYTQYDAGLFVYGGAMYSAGTEHIEKFGLVIDYFRWPRWVAPVLLGVLMVVLTALIGN